MKKLLLSLLLTIFLVGNSIASTVDTVRLHKDWSKLVDRVACEYVTSYIGALNSEAAIDFMSNVAPQLVSAKGEYVSTEKLAELLVQNSFQRTSEVLIPELEKRKGLARQDQTIERLTDISSYSAAMQEYLRESATDLKEALQVEYVAAATEEGKTAHGNSQKDSTNENEDLAQTTAVFSDYSTTALLLAIIAIETVLLLVRTSRKRISEVVKESNMMRKTYIRKDDDDIVDLRDNMKKIWERMNRIENMDEKKPESESDEIKFTHL